MDNKKGKPSKKEIPFWGLVTKKSSKGSVESAKPGKKK